MADLGPLKIPSFNIDAFTGDMFGSAVYKRSLLPSACQNSLIFVLIC